VEKYDGSVHHWQLGEEGLGHKLAGGVLVSIDVELPFFSRPLSEEQKTYIKGLCLVSGIGRETHEGDVLSPAGVDDLH